MVYEYCGLKNNQQITGERKESLHEVFQVQYFVVISLIADNLLYSESLMQQLRFCAAI